MSAHLTEFGPRIWIGEGPVVPFIAGFPYPTRMAVVRLSDLNTRRFDRAGPTRIPFLSAMAMTGSRDGERGSYPEIVYALARHGDQAKADAQALY